MKQETVIRYKGIAALFLAVAGVIFSPTVAEFIIASINRYQTYPVGTDTDMLANTTILQALLVLVTFIPLVLVLRKHEAVVIFCAVVVVLLMWASLFIPSFLPYDWCAYELRIYSCESGIMYQR